MCACVCVCVSVCGHRLRQQALRGPLLLRGDPPGRFLEGRQGSWGRQISSQEDCQDLRGDLGKDPRDPEGAQKGPEGSIGSPNEGFQVVFVEAETIFSGLLLGGFSPLLQLFTHSIVYHIAESHYIVLDLVL